MENYKLNINFSEIDKLLVPIKGDIYFHKNISPVIAKSKLERIALDTGFCLVKYLAYAGISYGLCEMLNQMSSWPDGADILKGI